MRASYNAQSPRTALNKLPTVRFLGNEYEVFNESQVCMYFLNSPVIVVIVLLIRS